AAWLNTFNPGTVLAKSSDHGRTWTMPVTMNGKLTYNDKPVLAISSTGHVYFGETGEGKFALGPEPLALVGSTDAGKSWTTTILATSQESPPCSFKGCYRDFFSSQATVASDSSGAVVFAYLLTDVADAPKTLYVRRSTDGLNWSAPLVVNNAGDSNMPAIASGPSPADFRLVWQDDRNGPNGLHTWYSRTTTGGG